MVNDGVLADAFQRARLLHEQGRLNEAALQYEDILKLCDSHFEALHQLGVLRAQQARMEEALGLFSRAAVQDPNCPETYNDMGFVFQALNRNDEAIACFDRAIAMDGDFAEAYFNRGVALQALTRHATAIRDYEKALAIEPDFFAARLNYGIALQALNRPMEAIAQFERAVAIESGHIGARMAFASMLHLSGDTTRAIEQYESALAIDGRSAPGREGLGDALQSAGRYEQAIAQYHMALAIEPKRISTCHRLTSALHAVNRYEQAVDILQRALELDVADADTHNNLGLTLQKLGRFQEAIRYYRQAQSLRPNFAAAHNNLGSALQALNLHEEAILEYKKAIAARPESAERHANLGVAFQEIGRIEDASQEFIRAVSLAPRNGRFYRNLADCTRFRPDNPHLAMMEELVRDIDSLPLDGQKQLLFALGKAYADIGDFKRSFGYILQGNALKRQHSDYDEAKVLGGFARIIDTFDAQLMNRFQNVGHPSPLPIFIVGMPRSGTTLVEQILASHSRVFGAGERAELKRSVMRLAAQIGGSYEFPDLVPFLPAGQLRKLGADYVASVSRIAPSAARLTDKMPLNFFFAGLIHLALPNARIIHTRRHPVDTCVSCFATLFTGEHQVAYELGELGRYYRAYESLMKHWRSLLPAHVLIEVQYEDLVANFEHEARRLVAHCGLEWENTCLHFDKARTIVRTASVAQVRRPIYRDSVGRWMQYGELLRPLLDALGPDTI